MSRFDSQAAVVSFPGSSPGLNGKATTFDAATACRGWVIPALREHVYTIVKDGIRKPDVLEQAALGRNADDALLQSFEASFPNVYTAVADGHPVAMFGVAPLAGQDPGDKSAGVVWLLASDRVFRITRDFIEQASAWIEHMNNIYPVLVNWTDERKAASRRWLEHVGFIFDESFEEVDGVKFLRFYRAG